VIVVTEGKRRGKVTIGKVLIRKRREEILERGTLLVESLLERIKQRRRLMIYFETLLKGKKEENHEGSLIGMIRIRFFGTTPLKASFLKVLQREILRKGTISFLLLSLILRKEELSTGVTLRTLI
jgi:hypothetical protein